LLACAFLFACTNAVKPRGEEKGSFGCPLPSPAAIEKTGVDIKVLESKVGAYVFGGVTVIATPGVERLASEAMVDAEIRAYLRCVQSHNTTMTLEQVSYFNKMNAYLRSNPLPDQWLQWHREHPFPNEE
jgi:hypothetical protein